MFKRVLKVGRQHYKNNGLLGISIKRLNSIRGGDDSFKAQNIELIEKGRSSKSKISRAAEQIDEILNDDRISDEQKKPFRNIREESIFDDSEKIKMERLRDSLIAKTKYPAYSKVKGKIPYAILTPFTFSELARLATYRIAGLSSAPFTIGSLIGISMPCAVTFSMLEMYAPDKLKLPCKCAKWSGGLVFYGMCSAVDYLSAPIETKIVGQPLPIDAPQLMGTLPQTSDVKELWELRKLAESMTEKAAKLDEL